MNDSMYEFVIQQLAASKKRLAEVAEGSGVPKRSIEKIASREWQNPGIQSIEKLAKYFRWPPYSQEIH